MLFILLLAVSTAFAQLNLKIMSYNVRNGKGMDGVHNLQRVADVINSAKADIVAVQELDSMTNRSGKKYVLGEIAALTNMHPEYFYLPVPISPLQRRTGWPHWRLSGRLQKRAKNLFTLQEI